MGVGAGGFLETLACAYIFFETQKEQKFTKGIHKRKI